MGLRKNNPRHIANERTGGKRTVEQRESDKHFCVDLFVKGYGYREIARRLNEHNKENGMQYSLSWMSVHADIKQVMIEWKKDNDELIGRHVELELRKLDKIETELWEAWEKSKIADGIGDPRYIDLLLRVQERRAKLLGYNAPMKLDLCGGNASAAADASAMYDVSVIQTETLVQVATQLQDAEFMRRKAEGAGVGAE